MSPDSETPVRIARHQLGSALSLFLRDKDPIAIQSLACGGCEIIERVAHKERVTPISTLIWDKSPKFDVQTLRKERNIYWNAIKHFTRKDRNDPSRDDEAVMATFSDQANLIPLFLGWWDYLAVTRKLPIEAQVFQVWWYGIREGAMRHDDEEDATRALFPDVLDLDAAEQKRRLNRAIEKYRKNKEVMEDSATEQGPLMPVGW